MEIFLHWFEASLAPPTGLDDGAEHIRQLLSIPQWSEDYESHRTGTQTYVYKIYGKNAVVLTVPLKNYGRLKLTGTYFDAFGGVPVHRLWEYVRSREGNAKRADVSYLDDEGYIDMDEYKRMCGLGNYKLYLSGSTVVSRKKVKGDCRTPATGRESPMCTQTMT